jgi:Uma2 family endonuclease
MGMPSALLYYTVEMVQGLPDDGNRYEAVHGELLVTPSPTWGHQRLAGRLYLALAPYVARHRLGELFMAPADLVHGPASIVQPDLLVLPFGVPEHGPEQLARALLLIEVLSPGSARADHFTKRRLYQEAGIPLYWLVDGSTGSVEEWRADSEFPRFVSDMLVWHPSGAGEPFELALAELFRPPGA